MGSVPLSYQGLATLTPDEFFSVAWPDPAPIFYRLYHDEQGMPLFYSMEDVPGTYIEISQEQYAASDMWVKVHNGQLVKRQWQVLDKIVPADTGTVCHRRDVALIASHGTKWRCRTYETD